MMTTPIYIFALFALTLTGVTSLNCSEFKQLYQTSNCCSGSGFLDTASSCSDQGVATRYHQPCGGSNTFSQTLYSEECCEGSTTTDLCDVPQSWGVCVVGTGIGAYGVANALKEANLLHKTIFFERGREWGYFASSALDTLGGSFPHLAIAAHTPRPESWNTSAGQLAPFNDTSGLSTSFAYVMSAASNVMGGLFMVNGGVFANSDAAKRHESARIQQGIDNCSTDVGIVTFPFCGPGSLCYNVTAKATRIIDGDSAYAGYQAVNEKTQFDFAKVGTAQEGMRVNPAELMTKFGSQYKTGTNIKRIDPVSDGYSVVDTSETTVATCDNVVLAAGVAETPNIIQSSTALNVSTDFTGYIDGWGCLYIFFLSSSPAFEATNHIPTVYSPTGSCLAYLECVASSGACFIGAYTTKVSHTTSVTLENATYVGQYPNSTREECIHVLGIMVDAVMAEFDVPALGALNLGDSPPTAYNTTSQIVGDFRNKWDAGYASGIYHGTSNAHNIVSDEDSEKPFKVPNHNIWIADASATKRGYAGNPSPKVCAIGRIVGQEVAQELTTA